MKTNNKLSNNYQKYIDDDLDNIFNLHPKSTIIACLELLGWSYRRYSRYLGKPDDYFNSRLNNSLSKQISFGDLITFRNVVCQYYPNIDFGELIKNAFILKGTNIVNPTLIINYYENLLKDKEEVIFELMKNQSI
jgi:hypothetical protein